MRFTPPAFVLLALSTSVHAIGQQTCVSFKSSSDSFSIVNKGQAAPILLSSDDWPGVQHAASNFMTDVKSVTGVKPSISNVTATSKFSSTPPIIVGTLGKSSLIASVLNHTKLDVSSISGQWEASVAQVVSNPLPGISKAYVIIGADKRGTIFSLYDHSEQMGVSPWYWWADVPATKHTNVFVAPAGCALASPTVKYRGLFLNDEQPALTNWAMEKFTNGTGAPGTGSPFNSQFYTTVFELLLRMKANYLWPAQWSSAFNVDDPQNQFLADMHGIVMGTSHEEPMMRSVPVEWGLVGGGGAWSYSQNRDAIYKFWEDGATRAKPYESLFTMGMRGNGDLPLTEGLDIQLLEGVIADQRQILAKVFNTTDVTTIPQVWTLYQEVVGFYDDGLQVPDDVTLFWTDDNWGNIVRLPIPSEFNRTGGSGVYYHYDLVGPPRAYKWITSSQISKTFEQLSLAVDRHATRVWIVNVGDLKPYELGIEFFMAYGWNSKIWNPNNLDSFVSSWATREFGLSNTDSLEVANIIANLTKWNMRRKPEYWNSTTYSLTNYREAETVMADWSTLAAASTKLYNKLSSDKQPAFFQTVHHPVMAASTLGTMWIKSGLNNLRASQARMSANSLADDVETLFATDYDLENQYHTMLDGKWNHMMDQSHVQYYYWQQPMTNVMPPVFRLQPKKQALPGSMRISPEGTLAAWPGDNQNQCSQGYNCPFPQMTLDSFVPMNSRYVDVGTAGPNPFTFTVTSNVSWVKITPSKGSVSSSNPEQRVEITADWSQVAGTQFAGLTFTAVTKGQPDLSVPVYFSATKNEVPSSFKGFVEGDGGISIEAAHASRNTSKNGVTWSELPGYGRTVSAVTPWPRTGNNYKNFTAGTGPSIEYDFFNFNTIGGSGNVSITTFVSPTLNNMGPGEPIAVAVSVDSLPPQTVYFIPPAPPGQLPPQWNGNDGFVANSIVPVVTNFKATPGAHSLKVWMVEHGVVVQKIVINTGNVRSSYLGPPESMRV